MPRSQMILLQQALSTFMQVFKLIEYKYVLLNKGDDDIPGIGQYDDFHTIDWQRDIARDRMRHRYIVKKRQDSIWDLIKVYFSHCLYFLYSIS